jgi:hypothetical protein
VAQQEIIATLEPYVKIKPVYLRDPLFLSVIPLDVWFSLGIAGMLVLCFRSNFKVAIILIIPVAINFAATAAAAVPNVRYAYALVPIYFFASIVGLQALFSKPVRSLVSWSQKSHLLRDQVTECVGLD